MRSAPAIALLFVTSRASAEHVVVNAHVGGEHFDYREEVPAPLKSTERGPLFAVGVEVETPRDQRWFLRGSLASTFGETTYDGSTQSGTPLVSETSNVMVNPELLFGPRFHPRPSVTLGQFVGAGFRFWRRDLRQSPGGYLEDYRWWTVSLGAFADFALTDRAHLGVEAALVPSFLASMDVRLSELRLPNDVRLQDMELEPEGKIGFRARVPFSFALTRALAVGALAQYEYSELGRSPAKPALTSDGRVVTDGSGRALAFAEPASRTHRIALLARVSFAF